MDVGCGYADFSSLHLAPRIEKGNFPSCLFKLQMQFLMQTSLVRVLSLSGLLYLLPSCLVLASHLLLPSLRGTRLNTCVYSLILKILYILLFWGYF